MPEWLQWLYELRNQVTHRQVLRLPEQLSFIDDGVTSPSWRSHVGIATPGGDFEPLTEFLTHVEQNIMVRLAYSLQMLTRSVETQSLGR